MRKMSVIEPLIVESVAIDIGLLNKTNLDVNMNELVIREKIARLEFVLSKMEQIDPPLKHTFTTGVYVREIFIPKDSVIVGKIHRHDHINFISYGDVTVLTKDGLKRIIGPCTMVSTAGTKRALYAHEVTVWTTIHANPTEERDLEKLEDFIIAKTYNALEHNDSKQIKFEVMP